MPPGQGPVPQRHAHAIQPAGVEALGRLGVLDQLQQLAPPIVRGRIVFDDAIAPVDDLVAICGAPALSVRRPALDLVLQEAATRAGAEVRRQTAATGLLQQAGRVVGVCTPAGEHRL